MTAISKKKIQLFFIIALLFILYYLFNNADKNIPKISNYNEKDAKHAKNLSIVYVLDSPASLTEYKLAIRSTTCYQQRHQHYALFVLYSPQTSTECAQEDFLFRFRRHCFIANWMAAHPEFQWLLILGGDVGVVNPNHKIEEYIEERNELIFIDRLSSNEVMVDGYLAKNTPFTRNFLHFWANFSHRLPDSFHGADNGAIHAVFMEKYAEKSEIKRCQDLWEKSKNARDLSVFTVCVRHFIDTRMAPDRTFDNGLIKILPKARGWMRAGCYTDMQFSPQDFMFYGWKQSTMRKQPSLCPWTNPFDPKQNFDDVKSCKDSDPWRYKQQFDQQADALIRIQSQVDEERITILTELGLYNGI